MDCVCCCGIFDVDFVPEYILLLGILELVYSVHNLTSRGSWVPDVHVFFELALFEAVRALLEYEGSIPWRLLQRLGDVGPKCSFHLGCVPAFVISSRSLTRTYISLTFILLYTHEPYDTVMNHDGDGFAVHLHDFDDNFAVVYCFACSVSYCACNVNTLGTGLLRKLSERNECLG